jgi:hypothetical protein
VTVRVGTGPYLAMFAKVAATDPAIICDGCGLERAIRGVPPLWWLDGRAPRGWWSRKEAGKRADLCPKCRAAQSAGGSR